jgi:hypothetical protein
MKKLSFLCSIILFLIVGLAARPVLAVETITVAGGETDPTQLQMETTELPTLPVVQKVEYTLPYPGMLPDHPLYFLKRVRDTILEKLISDPIRKAEFYILQGDKRLQMGMTLMDTGKGTLGESTISKAEKYMEQAVSGLSVYKKSGGVVPPYITERLTNATLKHHEVITVLMGRATEAEKSGLQGSLALLNEVISSIASLK